MIKNMATGSSVTVTNEKATVLICNLIKLFKNVKINHKYGINIKI